jgi:hypothetical protein
MYPIVVDNFFDNPDSVRNYALNLEYRISNNDGWLGYRCFTTDKIFSTSLKEKIHQSIPESSYIDAFTYYFHYSLEETKQTAPYNFHEYKVHFDHCDFAGLIYLHPDPPSKSGTSFYTEEKKISSSVENKFNRLIFYPGKILHAPTDLFGNSKEDGRLVLTFFSIVPKINGPYII